MTIQGCELIRNRDYKEKKPHGTLEFPCAGFLNQCTDNPKDSIPWHWHEGMEMLYLKTGHLRVDIPGKTIHLKQGESFFINSNVLHFASAEPYCEFHSLVFDPVLISGREHSIYASKYIDPLINCASFDGCKLNPFSSVEQACIDDFVTAFTALSLEESGYEYIVREKLSHICFFLYQRYEVYIETGPSELNQDSIRIRKMLDYIHDHFMENLELSHVAKIADIGERECLRCFRRNIRISPMQYLLKYRIMQGASMLLRDTNSSISTIAIQCGFDSPSNFSQMFKRFYNCTPREYRKHNLSLPKIGYAI